MRELEYKIVYDTIGNTHAAYVKRSGFFGDRWIGLKYDGRENGAHPNSGTESEARMTIANHHTIRLKEESGDPVYTSKTVRVAQNADNSFRLVIK